MFLRDIVRRRLEALLLPWLQDEPELELELGLINSRVTAKNLRFDVSSLNRLLGDSSGFSFGEFGVDHFSVGFSNWSAPAFKIEVRGVNVTLLSGEVEEDGSLRRLRRPSKAVSDETKKVLAKIDPEGSALHDVLERILVNATSKNRLKTSLLNLVFKHCHMQIFDIILQVRVPTSNDVLICLLQMKELNAESKYFEQGCLFRGLVGAAFKPLKETSINLDFRGFEFGYERNDHKNFIISSTDLFTFVKLTDLQIAELSICVPELSLSISLVEIPVLLVLSKLTSKESKHVRNGRQLWRLAADRLGYVISSPRLSLHNLVELVCIWLRYLNAYENLLSVFGHSADSLLEDYSIKISQDTTLLTSVKNNWEVICHTEKLLPVEAVAQARRIARYRAALDVPNGEDGYKQFSVNSQFKVFFKMLSVVVIIWSVICRMFLSMMNFFFLIKFPFQGQKSYEYSVVHSPQYCFLLNFGRILIKLSPKYTVQNVNEDIVPPVGISYSSADSVSLSIDALLLVYSDKIFEQSLSVSCGMLKVKSSSVIGATIMHQCSKNRFSTMKGHQEGRIDNFETVLHSEPADMFLPSQTTKTRAADQAEHAHNPLLKKLLGETWLNWKEDLTKYHDGEYVISESPWVLIDIKSCLMYPDRKSLDSGLWKCCLSVGKLNLTLAYPSVLSIVTLIGQIWKEMNWNEEHGTQSVLSNSPPQMEIQLESSWEGMYEFYVRKLKMAVVRRLPEKRIQLGVFITGPRIQLSLQKDGVNYGNDDMNKYVSHLGFNIHNIEVVIWPSTKCNLVLTESLGSDDAEPECLLREPQMIEIPKSDNEKFASQECIALCFCLRINGLDIYMGDWSEKQHNQIFVLKPIAVRLLLIRESVHSFSTTIIALSAALCGMAKGFTITLFMDELYVLLQVVSDLFLALSCASGSSDAVGCVPVQDLMVFTEPENIESTTEGALLIQDSTLISINGTFRFKSMDIVLHNSRMNDKLESPIEIYGAFGSQKSAGNDLPDCGIWTSLRQACVETYCGEEKLEALLNLSGIQSVLFHQQHIGKSFYHFVIEDLLQKFSNWLYEISISSCTFTLWLHRPCQSSDKPLDNSTSSSYTVKNSCEITESQLSNAHSSTFSQKMELPAPLSHWISISATLSGFYAGRCSRKNVLVGAHQSNELTSFLSVEGNLQKICWKMQGGLLLLETTALGMFARCFATYLDFIVDHLSNIRSLDKSVEVAEYEAQEIQHSKWRLTKAFSVDVSRFSFVLVVEDESGYFQELVLEVDIHMKLESAGMLKKFRIDLPHISIFIQVLKEYVKSENQIPHFSSLMPPESSSHPFLENSDVEFQHTNGAYISHQNHIVKHLVASLSVEKPKHDPLPLNQVWVGNGSVLGFDMIISLAELKVSGFHFFFLVDVFNAHIKHYMFPATGAVSMLCWKSFLYIVLGI
uniref:Uncharacterized protein LOC8260571 n=1 Tax=Rhizophora mucronata TaxID=61149 RepID=A0A2P2MKK3_RHIMU